MSLGCLVLRQLTRRAIENRTLADDRVRDSELVPLDALVDGGADGAGGTRPFISLYVDQSEAPVQGADWNTARDTVHLLLEVAIGSPVTIPPADGSTEGPTIPETSAGLEVALDLIAYQIKMALLGGATPWAELWRRLVLDIKGVETFRGAEFRKTGARFAARQIDLAVELLADPLPGAPLDEFWADAVAAFAADPEFDDLATVLTTIVSGEPLPQWRRDAISLGYTAADMLAIGDAPLDGSTTLDVVPMVEGSIDDAGADPADPALTVDLGQPTSFGA